MKTPLGIEERQNLRKKLSALGYPELPRTRHREESGQYNLLTRAIVEFAWSDLQYFLDLVQILYLMGQEAILYQAKPHLKTLSKTQTVLES